MQLPSAFVHQVRKDLMERSFKHFVKNAWNVLEPGTPLIWGWHIEAICDHLQAVSEGKINRLIISISPGSMKSLLTAVFWPAWEWTFNPSKRFVCTSHSLGFASRDSLRCRDLLTSEWYQSYWPFEMKEDANQTLKFINRHTGYRWAVPYSKLTGARGNCLVGNTIVDTEIGPMILSDIVNSNYKGKVKAYDINTGMVVYRSVQAVARNGKKSIYRVRTSSGRVVEATGEHLVFTTNRGWVETRFLTTSDVLLSAVSATEETTCDPVSMVELLHNTAEVYDIQVEGVHNFFANGILVHNCLLIDDPISVMDALTSDVEREKVNQTFLSSATSRLNNPKTDAIVIIAQRIHMDDLIGRLIDLKMDYVELVIPMEYVGPSPATVIGWTDPRKTKGELMLPERWGKKEIDDLKKVDIYAYSAQYQQNPVPDDDGFFKRDWFKRFDALNPPKHLSYYLTSDHAPSGKNDYNTVRVWGLDENKNMYLVDWFHEQSDIRTAMGISSTHDGKVAVGEKGALALIKKYAKMGGIQCWFAEPDNNFKSVESMVRDTMMHTGNYCRIEYSSLHNKNKKEKALAYQVSAQNGKVFIPNGIEGDETILEYISFPTGKHDDRVDADAILAREIQQAHGAIVPPVKEVKPHDGYKKQVIRARTAQAHLF